MKQLASRMPVNLKFALTLATGSHGHECPRPGIHDALAKSDDILEHFEGSVGHVDGCGLLQDLGDNGEVSLEGATNCLSNITEALKDSRLELVAERRALSKFVRNVVKLRMVR
jgi:hypothetical protein